MVKHGFLLLQEMACISMFMSGNPREQKYPFHYMESAITTYLQSCKYVLLFYVMIIEKIMPIRSFDMKKCNKIILFPLCI